MVQSCIAPSLVPAIVVSLLDGDPLRIFARVMMYPARFHAFASCAWQSPLRSIRNLARPRRATPGANHRTGCHKLAMQRA
jgi:hypothetical protein